MAEAMKQQNANENKWAQVVAHAWADENFKKRLTGSPNAALREHGLEVPNGVEIRVVEDDATVRHLTLPAKPAGAAGELSPEQLQQVAAGSGIAAQQYLTYQFQDVYIESVSWGSSSTNTTTSSK